MEKRRETIALLGLSEREAAMVRSCGLDVDVCEYDCATDVIACYYNLAIVKPAGVAEADVEELASFLQDVAPQDEQVVAVAEPDSAGALPFKGLPGVSFAPELFSSQKSLDLAIIDKLKETRRDVAFSRRIALSIRILDLIRQRPGITTRELAGITELSESSVRRYVRSLQAALMPVERYGGGWRCVDDPANWL
ncbi:MAG: winged helix-turn-helix transcriptional regulator [Coriobacteriales bacterium]